MAEIIITEEEFTKLMDLKNQGGDKLSEAWALLGEKGDAYAFLASPIVAIDVDPLSIPGVFYQMVRWQWENSGVGEDRHIWGDDEFFAVGQQHLENYLNFLSDNKVDGFDDKYTLPNTIDIEASYKSALREFGLPPITAIDSLFSVVDTAMGNGAGELPTDFSWAQMMNFSNQLMGGPAWQEDRIRFNSTVFTEGEDAIDPLEAVATFGRTLFNTFESYGGVAAAFIGKFAPAYWALKLVDEAIDYTMIDFANYNAASVLLKTLDVNITTENTGILLDAIDNDDRAAFGGMVDQLGKLFNIGIPVTNSDSEETHLFENVKTIGDWFRSSGLTLSITPINIELALSIAEGNDIEALAYRYALTELNPFIVTGDADIYVSHNINGELNIDNFSPQYLIDRLKMLEIKMQYGLTDTDYSDELDTIAIDGNWDYIDFGTTIDGSPLSLDVDGNGLSLSDHQIVFGSDANEILNGSGDEDHLYGGAGNDALEGNGGNDYLEGGAGEDDLYGGDDNDTASYASSSTAVTVSLHDQIGSGGDAEGDILYDIENLTGSNHDDILIGSEDQTNILDGGKGNDELQGLSGGDDLFGGEGNDTASYSASLSAVTVNLATGTATGGDATGDTFDSIENLIGSDYNDKLTGTGFGSVLIGGLGDDTYTITHSDDVIEEAENGGNDTVQTDNSYTLNSEQHIENLTLLGSDDINGTGDHTGNRIQGNSGNNILNGKAGNDVILAPGGNDTLLGGRGNDVLVVADSIPGLQVSADYIRGDWNETIINGGSGDDDLFAEHLLGADRTIIFGRGHGNDVLFNKGGFASLDSEDGTRIILEGLNRDDVTFYRPDTFGADFSLFEEYYRWTGVPIVMRINGTGETLTLPFNFFTDDYDNLNLRSDWQFEFADGETLNSGSLLGSESIWDDQIVISYYWQSKYQRLALAEQSAGFDTIGSVFDSDFNFVFFPDVGALLDPVNETGSASDDLITGSIENDNINGAGGNDVLMGALGFDFLTGGSGADRLYGDDGNDTLDGGTEADLLSGGRDNDTLTGGMGNDSFVFSQGDGDDTILDASNDDTVKLYGTAASDDQITRDDLLAEQVGNDLVLRYGLSDTITFSDWFLGNRLGLLEIYAGGSELPLLSYAADELEALINHAPELALPIIDQNISAGYFYSYAIPAGTFIDPDIDDTLTYNASLAGGAALPAWLSFDALTATFSGIPDNDSLASLDIMVSVTDSYGKTASDIFVLQVEEGNILTGTGDDDSLAGDEGNNIIYGLAGKDSISGRDGDDQLFGGTGNDWLRGGVGADQLDGGADRDTAAYTQSEEAVQISLEDGLGHGGTAEGDVLSNIENLAGSAFADQLAGNAENNSLTGREGDDQLSGGAGNDWLLGGIGADQLNGGDDRDTAAYTQSEEAVQISLEDGLGHGGTAEGDVLTNIENLTGSDFADQLTGNAENNSLTGQEGNDQLAGGAGNDWLRGGIGADQLDGGADRDTADYTQSEEAVQISLEDGLGHGGTAEGDVLSNIENLAGSAFADQLAGNAENNSLTGREGDDQLSGGAGNDWLLGGIGADQLNGGDDRDTAAYTQSEEAVQISLEDGLGLGGTAEGDVLINIENLAGSDFDDQLTGNAENNSLTGQEGNDQLAGGEGNDWLRGGMGADQLDGGVDRDTAVYTQSEEAVQISLEDGLGHGGTAEGDVLTNIENLTGSAFDDQLTGNAENNSLNGQEGNDQLAGGAGDDWLRGGMGADQLDGGADRDTAVYTQSEEAVQISLEDGLGHGGTAEGDVLINIENLTGSDFDDQLTGNAENNSLTGQEGNDQLAGGAGNDWLRGGIGADQLDGGADRDTATYTQSEEAVQISLEDGLGHGGTAEGDVLSNIENLTGSAFADQLAGNAENNSLTGREGDDQLSGGAGNDWLLGGVGADQLNGGDDRDTAAYTQSEEAVQISLEDGLGHGGTAEGDVLINIENLAGSDFDDQLTGNAENNSLTGQEGNDQLAGGAGNDWLRGGIGADQLDGGADRDTAVYTQSEEAVQISLEDGLGHGGTAEGDVLTKIENLTGSDFADQLTGNAENNSLSGRDGDDILIGGAGNDYLNGGAGDDRYIMGAGNGRDTINNFDELEDSFDILRFDEASLGDLWLSQSGDSLRITVAGTDDQVMVKDWYSDSDYQLDQIEVAGSVLLNSQVELLVQAMAAFDVPSGVGNVIPVGAQEALAPVLADTWQAV